MMDLLSRDKRVGHDGLVLTWEPGRNSIHDRPEIAAGRTSATSWSSAAR